MGPPAFTGGNAARAMRPHIVVVASMGPPAFTGGNREREVLSIVHHLASMGPPAFTGGNRAVELGRVLQAAGFNGAAGVHRRKFGAEGTSARFVMLLQWGRRRSPAEMGTSRPWPGPFFELQWGRRRSPAEIRALAPRRQALLASMGPPAFTGGNE